MRSEEQLRENGQLPSLMEAESVLMGLANLFYQGDIAIQPFTPPFIENQSPAPDAKQLSVEARYRTLVEQVPAVVFMAFLDGSIGEAYVSPHIEEILGYSQEEWLEDPVRWYQHIHPDDKGRWNIEAAQMFLAGKPLRSVYRVLARDGRVIWFRCEAKMVRRPDGQPWFIHGVGFDITEIKEAETALKEAHDELEIRVRERTAELARANAELASEVAERRRAESELAQRAQDLARSNAELEQFAYVASHDLQEPLRMVTSFTQLLVNRYRDKLGPDAVEFVDYIIDGSKRMRELINDLLEYSRVETRGRPLVPTDCSTVFAAACDNLRASIDESGADVTADSLPIVMGDATQLVQLFQNLIGNAIKYRSERPVQVHVEAKRHNGQWLFVVRDNGIGVEPQYSERIFVIFQRLHNRTEYPGTGIGLAICKKIVERHGGRIWLESQVGQGSAFHFLLEAINSKENIFNEQEGK